MSSAVDIVIFDWDGTLMDSQAHIVDCLSRTLASMSMPKVPERELVQVIGLGLQEAFAMILPQQGPCEHRKACTLYREIFLNLGPSPSTLFSGTENTLLQLQEQGYLLAVATGKSRRGLDKELDETGLASYFAVTRCADETFSKPHPLMLEEILTDLDAEVIQAVMVGDSEYDLQMANTIGMGCVGVSFGVHERNRLLQHQPLAILDKLSQLPAVLSSHNLKNQGTS